MAATRKTKKPKAKTPAPGNASAAEIAQYEALVATLPGIERKGDSVPYTSLNGNMFSYLAKDGVVGLRLGEADREAFLARFDARLMHQYGIVQKEYVEIPRALLGKTAALKPYFAKSLAYAKTLKPKPTTRKKK